MSTTTQRRGRLWLKILLGIVAFLVIALIAVYLTRNLWATRLAERFASEATGKMVTIEGLSIGPRIEVAAITVIDPLHPERPAARIGGVSAALDLDDNYKVLVDQVTVKSADIHWVEPAPETTASAAAGAPAEDNPAPRARRKRGGDEMMPRAVLVESLSVSTETPQGALSVGPVRAELRLKPSSQLLVEIGGTPRVQASGPQLSSPVDASGEVNVKITREKKDYVAAIKANLPGLLALDVDGKGGQNGPGIAGTINVRSGSAEGVFWAQLASTVLGQPVAFERLELTPGAVELNANLMGAELVQAGVALRVPHLKVGPASSLWVDAPVEIALQPGRIDLMPGAADTGAAKAKLILKAGAVEAQAMLLAALPPKVEVKLLPAVPSALTAAFPPLAAAAMGLEQVASLEGATTVTADALGINELISKTTATLKNHDAPLISEVTMARKNKGALKIRTSLGENNVIEVPAISPAAGLSTPLNYTIKLDLADVGGLAGLDGWGGQIDAKGTLHTLTGTPGGEFSVTVVNVVNDQFSMPLDVPLSLTTKFNLVGLELALNDFKASMPDGTDIAFKTGAAGVSLAGTGFSAQELTAALPASFLAAMGYLESGTGQVTLKASQAAWVGGKLSTAMQYQLALETLVLPDKLAAATALRGSGNVGIAGDKVSAEGTLSAGKIVMGGATLEEVSTVVHSAESALVLDQIRGRLFGGAVAGTLKVEPLEAGYPLTLDARLEGGGLDVFTREVQPPNVNLSGAITGDLQVGLRGEEFTALDLNLEAANGLTINRAMVQQLLMSQQVSVATGSKTVGKVLDKIVGAEEQRPFDTATLQLGLGEGRIVGDATLKSKALNLTVDIKADPGAFWEALKSRGQVSLGDITTQ